MSPINIGLIYQCLIALIGGEGGIRTLEGLFKPLLP